ncbi:MAG: N-acetylmuramoyl-L-alanine amidase [Chthoniobacterales bacterium]|nr:N-acetylmuramoyl-L-alanine amidase [Chthoniobacterales bacterium]
MPIPSGAQTAEEKRKRELFLRAREQIYPEAAEKPKPSPPPSSEKKIPPPLPPPATPRSKMLSSPKPSPTSLGPKSSNLTPLLSNRTLISEKVGFSTSRPQGSPPTTPETAEFWQAVPAVKPSGTSPTTHLRPSPVASSPEVVVGKSALQAEEGFVPSPSRGFLSGRRWRYLSASVRRAIDGAPVKRGRWKYIILHNSATRQGNARIFDHYHRRVRKMQNGLAYHFVIGNGSGSANGQIEIGHRWTQQLNGGHVASDYLNNIAIGICLVGDFDRDRPTGAQMEALRELLVYLRARLGRYQGKLAKVYGHCEINPRPTTCPGRRFPLAQIRREFP